MLDENPPRLALNIAPILNLITLDSNASFLVFHKDHFPFLYTSRDINKLELSLLGITLVK